MCGRYSITTPVEALSPPFRFSGPLPNLRPRYNVSPTQQVPIVRRAPGNGERELAQVRWGLIPFWAKDVSIGYKLIPAFGPHNAPPDTPRRGFSFGVATPQRAGPWSGGAEVGPVQLVPFSRRVLL